MWHLAYSTISFPDDIIHRYFLSSKSYRNNLFYPPYLINTMPQYMRNKTIPYSVAQVWSIVAMLLGMDSSLLMLKFINIYTKYRWWVLWKIARFQKNELETWFRWVWELCLDLGIWLKFGNLVWKLWNSVWELWNLGTWELSLVTPLTLPATTYSRSQNKEKNNVFQNLFF